jgi:carbamoyltransferase
MKLLSIVIPWHDANVSYFDGTNVYYHKFERTKQIKRFHFDNIWEWVYEIKNLWGIELSEIDEVVIDLDIEKYFGVTKIEPEDQMAFQLQDLIGENALKVYFPNSKIWYLDHHYCHALSTWMIDDKTDVSIVVDGLGAGRTWSIFRKDQLLHTGFIDKGSIGFEMMKAGEYLGVSAGHYNDIAGKVMGLQSYGKLDKEYLKILQAFDIRHIKEIFSSEQYQNYKKDELLSRLSPLDWIHTVHHRMGEVLVDLFKQFAQLDEKISYSGGIAQNVVWNTEIKKVFKNLVIPPHSSDEGLSLGALEWLRKKNNLPKFQLEGFPYCQQDVSPIDVPTEETIKLAVKKLAEGKIVGWYQGQGEIGPRALGNRSILMDPRLIDGKEKINKIKKREQFRPFGASILTERYTDFFESGFADPYMLYVSKIKHENFPAITHIDGTCRVQTVDNNNAVFFTLLKEFNNLTGCPILLNTSLNVAGKPLAGYPENAKDLFFNSVLDCLFIGNKFYEKV